MVWYTPYQRNGLTGYKRINGFWLKFGFGGDYLDEEELAVGLSRLSPHMYLVLLRIRNHGFLPREPPNKYKASIGCLVEFLG
jgi:hypothetical protein